jgi:hypothetical protein
VARLLHIGDPRACARFPREPFLSGAKDLFVAGQEESFHNGK